MGKRKRLKKQVVEEKPESKTSAFKVVFGFAFVLLIAYLAYYMTTARPASPSAREIEGSYTFLSNLKSTHEGGKVKMEIFFDFYCSHCYEFDSNIVPGLKREYGDKLEIEHVAYPLRSESLVPIQAYELAKDYDASSGEKMREAIFKATYVDNRNIGDLKVLKEIAAESGMDPEELERGITSQEKMNKIEENVVRGDRYDLEGTPMVVFDGQYKVDVLEMENLKKIMNSLLAL